MDTVWEIEIPWQPITELEVQRSLNAAKGSTPPGEDGLPTLVWKQLRTHLKVYITGIFTASVGLGYHPKAVAGRKDCGVAEA